MKLVVKVGTHAIAARSGRPDYTALRRLVAQLCRLRKAGNEVFFVSSGAVAAGVEALGLKARPTDVNDVQRERRLAGRFLSVALDDAPAREPADAQREVERERARRDDGNLLNLAVAESHDRHLAELLADLAHDRVQRGVARRLLRFCLLLCHDQNLSSKCCFK